MNAGSPSMLRVDPDQAVIVALGCNDKGDWPSCQKCLEAVLSYLEQQGLEVLHRSDWWSSQAWPDPADPPFINGVIVVRTSEGPQALMARLSAIENHFGRQRSRPNAPRTLDLDLIAYGRVVGDLEGLLLPHPRAGDRLFVMGPLAQIMPQWVHPVSGSTARDLAASATVGSDARPII